MFLILPSSASLAFKHVPTEAQDNTEEADDFESDFTMTLSHVFDHQGGNFYTQKL